MKSIKRQLAYILTLMLIVAVSCEDLDELNINPNGVDPSTADLNLLMPTIITSIGQNITGLGFGDLAGVMQHTQKDGWSSGHNDYDWNNLSHNWAGWYGILRNNEEMYNKAVEEDYVFHQLIMIHADLSYHRLAPASTGSRLISLRRSAPPWRGAPPAVC